MTTNADRLIKLRYETIDGFRESKVFKTLDGARAYFRRRIGETYDVGVTFGYAVDAYGTGKLMIREGTTWPELLDRPAADLYGD
jgi:hypothetical protein